VLGDVVIATAVVDHEIGHLLEKEDVPAGEPLFIRDKILDNSGYALFNTELVARAYAIAADTELADTTRSRAVMAFYGGGVALKPKVKTGVVVSGDNYWAGAAAKAKVYDVLRAYPEVSGDYLISEMETSAFAVVARRFGMLTRFLSIRDVVDLDCPPPGVTVPELWEASADYMSDAAKNGAGNWADYNWGIFKEAQESNFKVGRRIIDTICLNQP
jgi:purine nucleoside permease